MGPLLIIILVIVFFILASSIKIVKQQTAFTVETFGKFSRVIFPGFNLVIPIVENIGRRINLSTMNLDFSILAITSDKVNISIDTALIYRIIQAKAFEAAYSLDNPLVAIKALVEGAIRAFVATQTHEEVIRSRNEMTEYLTMHLTEKMQEYGYLIDSFQFRDIILPVEITGAMSRVVASKRLQEAAQNEAQADFIRSVKIAEAQKQTRLLQGEGLALERKAIIEGLAESILGLKNATGVSSQSVMTIVMMNQYMDTMRSMAKDGSSKVIFVNPSADGMQNYIQQVSQMISE